MPNKNWARGLVPIKGNEADWEQWKVGDVSEVIYAGQIVRYYGTTPGVKGLTVTVANNVTTPGTEVAEIIGVSMAYWNPSDANCPTHVPVCRARPGVVFEIQSDHAATTTAKTESDYLFKNFAVTKPDGGSTITGNSTMEVDFSSGSVTAVNGLLKCVGIKPDIDNDVGGDYPYILVEFNAGRLISTEKRQA
jgi:hypothetical protein